MVFDTDAVKQVVRPYIGYYLVKAGSVGSVLQYKSESHNCSVLINCGSGEITVRLNEEYRGKSTVVKKSENYNTIHEVMSTSSHCSISSYDHFFRFLKIQDYCLLRRLSSQKRKLLFRKRMKLLSNSASVSSETLPSPNPWRPQVRERWDRC